VPVFGAVLSPNLREDEASEVLEPGKGITLVAPLQET
jgi:hypothetical protein